MMKKNIKYILICFVCITLTMRLNAAFKDNGWGARPAGMGGAFAAVADDADAPLYNPAGIMQIKCPEGSFMYSQLYTGLEGVDLGLNYFSYAHPTRSLGAFGVNWANFTAESLYREDTFSLTYATSLNDFYEGMKNEYLVGANIKYLRNSFTLDTRSVNDPVFAAGRSADALSLDAGFLVNFYEESVGLSIKNINEPDVGLRTREIAYREYRLGFASLLGTIWKLEEALISVDLNLRDNLLNYHVGWENWFARRTFAIRFGTNQDEVDMGFGYAQALGSSGLSVEFNYALLWPLEIEDTTGSHRASVSLRFGGSSPAPVPAAPEVEEKVVTEPEERSSDAGMIEKAREIVKTGQIKVDKRGLVVNLSTYLLFDFGKSMVKYRGLTLLEELAELLSAYPKNNIIIEGHTDSIGTHISNQRLSEARAGSVHDFLVKKGIDKKRIKIVGYGETKPISDNNTNQGRTENRRVEIVIIK